MSPIRTYATGFFRRASSLVDEVQALEDAARAAGLGAIAERLRHARQHIVEAVFSLVRREGGER